MSNRYCWHPVTKQRYEIVSKDHGAKKVTIKNKFASIIMSMDDYNKRFKEFSEIGAAPAIMVDEPVSSRCECGVDKTYGEGAPLWMHSDWCPRRN